SEASGGQGQRDRTGWALRSFLLSGRSPAAPRMRQIVATRNLARADPLAFAALLMGSSALAFGPWLVRLAGTGPVAAGFWRLALALPFLWILARLFGQPVHWPGRALALLT